MDSTDQPDYEVLKIELTSQAESRTLNMEPRDSQPVISDCLYNNSTDYHKEHQQKENTDDTDNMCSHQANTTNDQKPICSPMSETSITQNEQELEMMKNRDPNFDLSAVLGKIENLCKILLPEDQEYVFLTANPSKKNFEVFGTEAALKFIHKSDISLPEFVKFCYEDISVEDPMTDKTIVKDENQTEDMADESHNASDDGEDDVIDVEKSIENIIKSLVKKKNMSSDDVLKELVRFNDFFDRNIASTSTSLTSLRPVRASKSEAMISIDEDKDEELSEDDDENDEDYNESDETEEENEAEDVKEEIEEEEKQDNDESDGGSTEIEDSVSEPSVKIEPESEDALKCKECSQSFATKKLLRDHVKEHTQFKLMMGGKNNLICKECGQRFKNKAMLKRHCKTHFKSLKHKCSICSKRFARSDTLNIHMNRHNQRTFSCPKCNQTYFSRSSLYKHQKRCETRVKTEAKLKCDRCTAKFSSEEFLQNHLKEHDILDRLPETKDNKCPQCEKTFNSHLLMKRHYKTHMNIELYKCPTCSKSFSRSDIFKNHLNCHEEPKFSCDTCSRKYNTKSALNKHVKRCGLNRSIFECSECKVLFKNKENYELHICNNIEDPENFTKTYKSKMTEDGKFVCGICDKVFEKRKGLLQHRKLHSSIGRTNICDICNKAYRSKEILRKHKLAVHAESKNFVCDLCGKGFTRSDGLKMHMKTHNDDDSEKKECNVCGKFLSSRQALNVHMRLHVDATPYMCEVCGKSFRQQSNLRSHKLVHTDEATFQCEQCPRKLKSLARWKVHMRAHAVAAGVSDAAIVAQFGTFYTCKICQKKMATATQYKQHLRSHSNERPFCCEICSKYFKENSKLKRHMKNVHSDRIYNNAPVSLNVNVSAMHEMHSMSNVQNVVPVNMPPPMNYNPHPYFQPL